MQEQKTAQEIHEEIALKVLCNDQTALEDILRHYSGALERALVGRFNGSLSLEDAEDVVCEAVRRFWQHRATYDDKKGSVRCLLYVIARNLALDLLKKGRRRRSREVCVEQDHLAELARIDRHLNHVDADDGGVLEPESQARQEAARRVLASLPEVQRQILTEDMLAEDDGVEAAELGARLGGLPASTVRVYRKRARDAFRKGMSKLGFDL